MCQTMEGGEQIQDEFPGKDHRKQLEATVRRIEWSYAIFWKISARQQGVLEWGDGYYNGDIKTMKTTQPMKFTDDQMGLQRSEQLRELYESLSLGDSNQQIKRPSASLSPEDLTATEWYYLVCMSFMFTSGQGLPGKALTSNQHIWLSDAPFADSKTFRRSLLAKSASVQTVVCFPFMDGVLELGTTEEVLEDTNLIQQVLTSFWDLTLPISSEQSISSPEMAEKDEENMHEIFYHGKEDTLVLKNHNLVPKCPTLLEGAAEPPAFALQSYVADKQIELTDHKVEEPNPNIFEELRIGSPDISLDECCPNHHTGDSLGMQGRNGTSRLPSQQLMDDEANNCLCGSLRSSDCISQCYVNPQKILSSPKGERISDHEIDYLKEGSYAKLTTLDLDGTETHYQRTLAAILRSSKELASAQYFLNGSQESSFTVWTSGSSFPKPPGSTSQKLLKKILIDGDWICGGRQMKLPEENGNKSRLCKSEADDNGVNHVLSERRRREKLNEKFLILKSLVPSISKVDKASILDDTIEYLKELEKRVEELESCTEIVDVEGRGRRKNPDMEEKTSDNYGDNEDTNSRKPSTNKRKACEIEEAEAECNHWFLSKDGAVDINVTIVEKEVMVELGCPWRDCLLLDVLEAMGKLHLDTHAMKSTTNDNVLALTLKAKIKGSITVSPGTIKGALQRVVGNLAYVDNAFC